MMWSVVHDKPKQVTLLLNDGASPYVCDSEGSTALHICATRTTSKSAVCAKALIKREAKLANTADSEGQVALHRAVAADHHSVLQFLAKCKGISLDIADVSGRTPLHWACALGQSMSNSNIAPLFVKMAQNLDLRCVLVPAPWVLGPKHVSNPE